MSKDPQVYLAHILECIQKIERFTLGEETSPASSGPSLVCSRLWTSSSANSLAKTNRQRSAEMGSPRRRDEVKWKNETELVYGG